MVLLFRNLHHVTQNCTNLNNNDQNFLDFSNKHIFYEDANDEHLYIPVHSGIKTPIGPEFILNTLLSLGRFSTKRELLFNDTLIGCFNKSKLIGDKYDPKFLQNYLNQVINIFFNNQFLFFTNGQHMIAFLLFNLEICWIASS